MIDNPVIIGGGPAAVAAALPFAEQGRPITIIEPGPHPISSVEQDAALFPRLETALASPKVRSLGIPRGAYAVNHRNKIKTDDFLYTSTMASGGAGSIWGAVLGFFDEADLSRWPISPTDLVESGIALSNRIGISGEKSSLAPTWQSLRIQEPIQSSPLGDIVLRPETSTGHDAVTISNVFSAVASERTAIQNPCDLSGVCFSGCPNDSIYDARIDLEVLSRSSSVQRLDGWFLQELSKEGDHWQLQLCHSRDNSSQIAQTRTVILCAGALASLRHGLRATGKTTISPVEHNPAFSAAFINPKMLGSHRSRENFALGQAACSIRITDDPDDRIEGVLYDVASVPSADLAASLPSTMSGGIQAFDCISNAMLVGLFYLTGRYAENTVSISGSGDEMALKIEGGVNQNGLRNMEIGLQRISKALSRRGFHRVPMSTRILPPGGMRIMGEALAWEPTVPSSDKSPKHPIFMSLTVRHSHHFLRATQRSWRCVMRTGSVATWSRSIKGKTMRVLVPTALSLLFVIHVFFAAFNGDEGPFLSMVSLYADGHHPIIDFFSGYAPSWLMPYAGIMSLFESNHIELGRLVSLAFTIATALMAGWIAERCYGRSAFIITFLFVATNGLLVFGGLSVRHQAVSNFGAVFACYILTRPTGRSEVKVALASLGVALAAASRLPLILTAIPVAYYIFSICIGDKKLDVTKLLRLIGCAIAAGVLGLSIFIYPVWFDPSATLFNLYGYRSGSYSSAGIEVLAGLAVTEPRLEVFMHFLLSSQMNLVAIAAITIGVFLQLVRSRSTNHKSDLPEIRIAKTLIWLFALSIIVAYLIPSPTFSGYFIPTLNFFLILVSGELIRLSASSTRLLKWTGISVIVAVISIQTGIFVAKTAYSTLARDWGSARSVSANTKLACWLESSEMPSDAHILSWSGSPPAISGVHPPLDFSRGIHTAYVTWGVITNEQARRYNVMTLDDFKLAMSTQQLFMIIDDSFVFHTERVAMPWYRDSLSENYQLVENFAGFHVFVAKDRFDQFNPTVDLPHTIFHEETPKQKIVSKIRNFKVGWLIDEFSGISERIYGSFMRVFGFPFESRCANILSHDQHVTSGWVDKM